jgi:hypothetical protein
MRKMSQTIVKRMLNSSGDASGVALGHSLLHNAKTRHRRNGYMALMVGDLAPDFELPAVEGEQRLKIKLSDFRGKKHVLVTFHPLNWTPT